MTTDDDRSTQNDPTAHQEAAPGNPPIDAPAGDSADTGATDSGTQDAATAATGTAAPGADSPGYAAPGAATASYPTAVNQAPATAWPTPTAPAPRARRKTLVITGIAVGALILLGGTFAGGIAVGHTIDRPGPGSFSEQMMPGGPDGPGNRGGAGELPQPPTRDEAPDTDQG